MKRSIVHVLVLAALALAGGPVSGAAASDEAPGLIPRPCFVPPHPLKQGGKPRIEAPRRILKDVPTEAALGGPAYGYHDTHLRDDGVADLSALGPVTRHALVLLVDFDDQEMGAGFSAQREDSIRIYYNRVMTHLNQMYTQMSDGLLSIQWELTPVYRMPRTMAYYGLDDSIATRESALCLDAVLAMDDDYDFSQYDTFMLFHAGAGQEADIDNDGQKQIWSVFFRGIDFQYWLVDPRDDCEAYVYSEQCDGIRTEDMDPRTNAPFRVPHMVILPEVESQDGYDFGMLGTVAHEFGHSFGLPDLYDTTAPEDFIFADSQGIGAFGLMGAGIWNDNGFFPAEFCAWSRFYVGWTRPRVIRPDELGGETLESLGAIVLNRRDGAIRIPLSEDQYFLIENRIRDYNGNGILDFDDANDDSLFEFWSDSYAGAEFDWHLPRELQVNVPGEDGSGLLIWHIDESILREYLLYNLVNAEALHKGVDLEEADGIQDLDKLEFSFEAFGDSRDAFWAPYATEFTPFTEPNTDGYGGTFDGAYTGIWITDISGPGPTMTFRLRFTSPDAAVGDFRDGWPRDLPGRIRNGQPVTGDLNGDGRREIIVPVADDAGNGGLVVLDPDGTSFFNPGSGPEIMQWGKLNSDPVLANLDGQGDPLPELIWVSADTLYARKGSGSYLAADGGVSAGPAPYFVFDADPGPVHLSVNHIEPQGTALRCGGTQSLGEWRPEILVAVPSPTDAGMVDILAIAAPAAALATTHPRVLASVPGVSGSHITLADLDHTDDDLREIVTSIRTETGGYLAVTLYDILGGQCRFTDARTIAFSVSDTVSFTPPVAGDVDRDGIDEILVGSSDGYLHLLRPRIFTDGQAKIVGVPGEGGPIDPASFVIDNTKFQEYPGWPAPVGVLQDDGLSLADVDDDGLLEALAFGPINTLHILNYNGTAILTLPVAVEGEDRFTQPFLSPLVLDVEGDAEPEMVLPLPDGQVRGADLRGRSLGWSYLGGGEQGAYPIVQDLDGDGDLELVTTEDVTTSLPDTTDITEGDTSPGIPHVGRVLVRNLGPGTGLGPWPVFRHDAGRSGLAPAPGQEPGDTFSSLLSEAFVMPNPVLRREDAGFHYRVRSDVQAVTVEVYAADGRLVRTLDGPVDVYTDNLLSWNLTNENGNGIAPGIYLARFQAEAGASVQIKTVTFVVIR